MSKKADANICISFFIDNYNIIFHGKGSNKP